MPIHIEEGLQEARPKSCPYCGSSKFVKCGIRHNQRVNPAQKYRCRQCSRTFTHDTSIIGMHFPKSIVDRSLELSKTKSVRAISAILKQEFHVTVSYVAVAKWIKKYSKTSLDILFSVPCFKCILNNLVGPYYCKPTECENLENSLLSLISDSDKFGDNGSQVRRP